VKDLKLYLRKAMLNELSIRQRWDRSMTPVSHGRLSAVEEAERVCTLWLTKMRERWSAGKPGASASAAAINDGYELLQRLLTALCDPTTTSDMVEVLESVKVSH
jgi:hypothetical protein